MKWSESLNSMYPRPQALLCPGILPATEMRRSDAVAPLPIVAFAAETHVRTAPRSTPLPKLATLGPAPASSRTASIAISAPLPLYTAYIQRHAQALRTSSMQARQQVIEFSNLYLLPKLKTEEAALQLLLAPITNMKWMVGWNFSLFIERNLAGDVVSSYAKNYQVNTIFSDPRGGFGVQLRPMDATSNKADVLLVPGTYSLRPGARDALALADGRPIGMRDDLAWAGIGRVGARNIQLFADACLADAQASGRKLVVAGHSLGSAISLRWMASLAPQQRTGVDLLAFVPPGLDKKTAKSLESSAGSIRLLPHFWDIVRFSGIYRAPGREYLIRDYIHENLRKSHHALPHLAIRELRGESPQGGRAAPQPARFIYLSPIFELFRRLFGFFLWPFLPA